MHKYHLLIIHYFWCICILQSHRFRCIPILTRGYVSVKTNGIKSAYTGRFGTGYTVKRNNPDSTRYCYVDYYIEK
nr:MAG TPA: hypothetical protein [Caudoviricetes sp.]